MSSTEGLAPFWLAFFNLHIFVAVANNFFFAVFTRLYHKLLLGMSGRSFWLVTRHGLFVDLAA